MCQAQFEALEFARSKCFIIKLTKFHCKAHILVGGMVGNKARRGRQGSTGQARQALDSMGWLRAGFCPRTKGRH